VRVTIFVREAIDLRGLHAFPTRRSSDLACRSTNSMSWLLFEAWPATALNDAVRAHHRRRTPAAIALQLRREAGSEQRRARYRRRSEEHTSELQSRFDVVCGLLLEK